MVSAIVFCFIGIPTILSLFTALSSFFCFSKVHCVHFHFFSMISDVTNQHIRIRESQWSYLLFSVLRVFSRSIFALMIFFRKRADKILRKWRWQWTQFKSWKMALRKKKQRPPDWALLLVSTKMFLLQTKWNLGAIAIGDLVKSTLGPRGMDKILYSPTGQYGNGEPR